MIGVKFFDNSSNRAVKIRKRKELLDIISTYPDWMESDFLVEQVQEIGRLIGDQTMDGSKPIESIDPELFTIQEYRFLKFLGYSETAIYQAIGLSKKAFAKYREDHLRINKEDRRNERKREWDSPA